MKIESVKNQDRTGTQFVAVRFGNVLGSNGSVIYDGKDFHLIPAYKPTDTVDATGCGDTYMTGYLYCRAKNKSIDEAGRFAAAISTLKIEAMGPFSGTKADIEQCIRTAEQTMPVLE